MTARLILCGLTSMWLVPAWSQQIPRDMVGDWSRIQGETEAPLTVDINQKSLTVENHLDGEGFVCDLPLPKLRIQQIGKGTRKLVLITGNAVCQVEENTPETSAVIILYSKTTEGAETWVFADGAFNMSTEFLQRANRSKR
jgi:hypothetical protein